jgi:N-acetylglucosaminyldiphosphoundecaprenol N-acetyl-beta-D-mannosaminyltransferase
MLDACRRDVRLGVMLGRASLSLPDGAGVLHAARRMGTPLRERVAGIDFGEALLCRAEEQGLRVFLLGGREGVAERAAERLCARHPSLRVCGCCWGYFARDGESDRALIGQIRATRPDVLLVCMGFPLQERWIEAHLHLLDGVRVVAGLGGSLDVWSGDLRRAPRFVSRVGLEWAWRMAREPRRLRDLPAVWRMLFGR